MIGARRQVDRRVIVVGGLRMIHVLMGKSMRLGKLRRVQDRLLGAAQHGHGKQSCNQDMLDDAAHPPTKARYSGFVKTTAAG